MRRRDLIRLIGAATAWPLAARARPAESMRRIGVLMNEHGRRRSRGPRWRSRLSSSSTSRNVAIEYRWAQNAYDHLPEFAGDPVRRQVAVIAATGGSVSALAAKSATASIPIVFVLGDLDPVAAGLVTSLNRPTGNITGLSFLVLSLGAKRLELLHGLVPNAYSVGMLLNPNSPDAEGQLRDVQNAGRAAGQQIHVLKVGSESELEAAFAIFAERRTGAVVIGADPFITSRTAQLVALAARARLLQPAD